MSNNINRPALRYPGGKWTIAPWILDHLPPHRCYVEPFGGAASVLLRKPRSTEEVYNDLDDRIVGLMRVLRDPVLSARLVEQLELTPYAESEFEGAYEISPDPVEDARRMAVLSLMSFSPVAATRRNSSFQDSTGSNKSAALAWTRYPDALPAIRDRLRQVIITRRMALEVVRRHDRRETLFYCDPPYVPETRAGGEARDYRNELTVGDHIELLDVLLGVEGMVVLSGYPSALYDDALIGWRRVTRGTHTHSAKAATEVLWINPAAVAASAATMRQSSLFPTTNEAAAVAG